MRTVHIHRHRDAKKSEVQLYREQLQRQERERIANATGSYSWKAEQALAPGGVNGMGKPERVTRYSIYTPTGRRVDWLPSEQQAVERVKYLNRLLSEGKL